MKKIICGIFSLVLLIGCLAGCSENSSESNSSSSSTYSLSSRPASSKEPASSEETQDFPECVVAIQEKLSAVALENNSELGINKVQVQSLGGYEIPVTLSDGENDLSLWFQAVEYDEQDDSFHIGFEIDKNSQDIKEIIALIFQALDPSLDQQTANEKMQSFVNTFSSKKFSDIVECGDYLLLLVPGDGFMGENFRVQNKAFIWEDIDESQYAPVDYATYQAGEMNAGTEVYVEGTVQGFYTDDPTLISCFAHITVAGTDGNLYEVNYPYEYSPVSFNTGDRVKIFGTIGEQGIYASNIQTLG